MAMAQEMKIAGLQMAPKILQKEKNLARCLELIELTAREGAKLIVVPECALTGYCFSSLQEALPVVEPIPGPSTEKIAAACRELDVYVVVLVFPSNWPETATVYPDYIVPTRAIENRVFCIAVDRVGEERGTRFLGRTIIAHWFGRSLAEGKRHEEDILYAEIEPAEARQKHFVIIPGQHEVDFIRDRKPEFYGAVCQVPSTS